MRFAAFTRDIAVFGMLGAILEAAKWALSLYLAARIAVVPPAGMAASTKATPVTSPSIRARRQPAIVSAGISTSRMTQ